MRVDFDQWLPDQADYENPGNVQVAKNVWPAKGKGFDAALDWQKWNTGSAATFTPRRPYASKWKDGTDLNLLGASSRVALVEKTGFTDITSSLSLTTLENWDFTTFGDFVVAVTPDQAPIKLDLSNTSNVFALVTGSPPSGAKCIGRVRDFLVLGNTTESSVDYPSRVRWSGFNNQDTWGSDASTQADFQDMKSRFGGVERIVPGSVGYIFQESAITRMSYIGPQAIFKFDTIFEDSGTIAPDSIVWTDSQCFFYSQNGFQNLDLNTGQIRPIGSGAIDEWFFDEADKGDINLMQGAIDHVCHRVFWAFNSSTNHGESPNRFDSVLVYDWTKPGWSYMQSLFSQAIGPFELSGDTRDSTYIVYQTAAGLSQYNIGFFDGDELASEIQTGDFGSDGQLMFIDGARPIVERGSANITTLTSRCSYRTNELHDAEDGNTGDVAVNSIGRSNFRVSARYANMTVKTTGPFRRLIGVEFNVTPDGER